MLWALPIAPASPLQNCFLRPCINGALNSIQEIKDYSIIVNISPSDRTELDLVQVRCGCTRKFTLSRKTTGNQPWQIWNWRRHFTSCGKKECATRPKSQFFQPNEANKQPLPSTMDDLALETDFLLHELSQHPQIAESYHKSRHFSLTTFTSNPFTNITSTN